MANDGQIVFEVTADGKHAIADVKDITKAIQAESKKWDDAAKQSTDGIGDKFSSLLKKLTVGFSALKIGKALLDIGKDALQAASDLQEVQNVVDVTFGDGAKQIDAWAKKAGMQFGLTETKAKQFASTMGAMMKSSGVASKDITEMSTTLAGLAADMSSFYNMDFDTAFQKIRSGISGETEPLKQLGINMSVANLNAFALQQGLEKTFDQMDQGEQTMLRYQYLMQATSDAQGDFARTSDGYANSLRQLESNVESIKTIMGQAFIGVVAEATGALNGFLQLLIPEEKPKTVLDDFATINLQTEEKLAQIQTTAEQARLLTSVLDEINSDATTRVGTNVAKLVEDLGKINLRQGNAEKVKELIQTLAENIDVISEMQGSTSEEAQTWLSNIAQAANELEPDNVDGWRELFRTISDGLPGLDRTEFGADFFNSINNLDVGEKAQIVKDFIGQLANNMELVQDLSGKDAEGASEWLTKISEAANNLEPNNVKGWQDLIDTIKNDLPGLGNTEFGAEFFNAVNNLSISDKAQAIKSFIGELGNNMQLVQSLSGKDAEGASEWLTSISEAANKLEPEDAEGWKTLLTMIKEGLPGLENTEFGQAFFASLEKGFGEITDETSVLDWVMESLGEKTNRTAEEQQLWLETCKRLVQTIPGLSSIINTETGEVKGGVQAIKEYVDAWQSGQEKMAKLRQLQAMQNAYDQRYSEIGILRLDAMVATNAVKRQADELEKLYKQYGIEQRNLPYGTNIGWDIINGYNANGYRYPTFPKEGAEAINAAADAYNELATAEKKAVSIFEDNQKALEDAQQVLDDMAAEIEAMPDGIDDAASATDDWLSKVGKTADEVKDLTIAVKESLQTLADYAEGIREGVAKAVDSVINGFDKIGKAGDDLRSQQQQLAQDEAETMTKYTAVFAKFGGTSPEALQRMKDNWNNLTSEEKDAYNALVKLRKEQDAVNESLNQYKPSGMKENLQGQLAYMNEYLENLKTLQSWGLSNDLLAFLSDGSAESAEYLAGLATDREAAQEIDKIYQDVKKKKDEFTNELTGQQLTVDKVYQSMMADAKAAVEALDLEDEAKENSGKTVEGIAQGIADKVPAVQQAVDAILAQLERLNGLNITLSLGNQTIPIFKPGEQGNRPKGNVIQGEFAEGLDFVPFDGFLASLHQGESILTAEENKIWQRFRNGSNGIDYDTMGGVMRDNIKAGGNVYLDGRVVGSVISDQQGRLYRQLQRSGWQG